MSTSSQDEEATAAPASASPMVYGWKGFTGDLSIQSYAVLSPYKIRSIAAGGGHVLFLTESGRVYGRGHNAHGQLGLGAELAGHAQSEPVLITALAGKLICTELQVHSQNLGSLVIGHMQLVSVGSVLDTDRPSKI